MRLGLEDWTVLVTGASGGIGWSCAEVLAAEGARLVLLAGRRGEALERATAARPWADRALSLGADVTDAGAMEEAFARGRDRFGRIDGVVASAGVWPPQGRRLDEMGIDQLRRTLDVNLFGSLTTARAFMRSLRETGARRDGAGGSLVLIGSTAGRFGEPGHVDYACSKAGLRGLTLSLRRELAAIDPYARVNLVEPGWTATEMAQEALDQPGAIESTLRTMPVRQVGRAEDMARAVAFFLSPRAARHVSGEILTVAGGMDGRVAWERDEIDRDEVLRRLAPDPEEGPR
jgi:3-oxoacyl-[acyl-carrier protein] reductase